MLDALSACLMKQNVEFIRIDGTTKSDLRIKYIDRFQNHKSCQVALLSLKGTVLLLFAYRRECEHESVTKFTFI